MTTGQAVYSTWICQQRDDSCPRRDRLDSARFLHANQNGAQCKIYELRIVGVFHICGHISPHVTETPESGTVNKGELL